MMILINNLNNVNLFDDIYIHEDHYHWLIKNLEQYKNIFDIDIRTSPYIPKWRKRWIFPYTPFVEYEKSDEVWARSVGFGHEEDTDEPAIFVMYKIAYELYSPFKTLKSNLIWNS